jgi:hypothetical protein
MSQDFPDLENNSDLENDDSESVSSQSPRPPPVHTDDDESATDDMDEDEAKPAPDEAKPVSEGSSEQKIAYFNSEDSVPHLPRTVNVTVHKATIGEDLFHVVLPLDADSPGDTVTRQDDTILGWILCTKRDDGVFEQMNPAEEFKLVRDVIGQQVKSFNLRSAVSISEGCLKAKPAAPHAKYAAGFGTLQIRSGVTVVPVMSPMLYRLKHKLLADSAAKRASGTSPRKRDADSVVKSSPKKRAKKSTGAAEAAGDAPAAAKVDSPAVSTKAAPSPPKAAAPKAAPPKAAPPKAAAPKAAAPKAPPSRVVPLGPNTPSVVKGGIKTQVTDISIPVGDLPAGGVIQLVFNISRM